MDINHITDLLKKTFPHWTEKEVSDFVKFLSSSFKDLSRNDEHIVLTTLNDSIIKVMQRYDIPSTQPGRLRTIYRRNMLKIYKKKSRTTFFDGVADYLGEHFDGLDQVESIEKIDRFFKSIRSSNILTDALEPLCDHIEIVAHKMLEDLSDGTEKWSRKDFWEEVEKSLLNEGITLTDVNFRQLQKRLRDRITEKRPDAEGLLHLAQKNMEEANAVQILYAALSAARSRTDYLLSYRFSVDELEKMIWLKKLFEENGFSFDPNRFPEVYYDDYEKVNPDDNHWNPDNINPDVFGIYSYETSSTLPCAESYEGHIILFKDRIESYCAASGADVDSVRFVVLMHELGHWFAHWALKNLRRWNYGMILYSQTRRTHEAFAQLIAYWASESNELHLKTLIDLSPQNASGKVDATRPYGDYIELTKYSKILILKKLVEIREYWILKDEIMIEYLKSDFELIEDWATKKLNDSPGTVFVESTLKDVIFGNEDCADTFMKELDLKKLLELSIIKIEFETIKNTK